VCCLAGCVSRSQQRALAPDWESDEFRAEAPPPAKATAATAGPPEVVAPQVPPAAFNETWVPLKRWCLANGFAAPVMQAAVPLPTYLISSSNGTLRLQAGTRVARWDGLDLRLGFAPQAINNQPFVHFLDLAKTIGPLLAARTSAGRAAEANARPVIVIDPGHGGENAGTRSAAGEHFEKEFTLDWGRRLQNLLVSQGWQVFLTRTDDRDVAISNRVAFAQERKADLFLSLHFNSSFPNDNQAGLETYCLTPSGMPSTVTREFEDNLAEVLPNNAFDVENLQLALSVHRALLQVNGHRDRGVRRARFLGVLRGQQRPAILIEGGYLSNPQEARRIAEPEYRQKLADAVARGLGVPE
jgi:N-acetylmuramoyl-L-alanine amidase